MHYSHYLSSAYTCSCPHREGFPLFRIEVCCTKLCSVHRTYTTGHTLVAITVQWPAQPVLLPDTARTILYNRTSALYSNRSARTEGTGISTATLQPTYTIEHIYHGSLHSAHNDVYTIHTRGIYSTTILSEQPMDYTVLVRAQSLHRTLQHTPQHTCSRLHPHYPVFIDFIIILLFIACTVYTYLAVSHSQSVEWALSSNTITHTHLSHTPLSCWHTNPTSESLRSLSEQ